MPLDEMIFSFVGKCNTSVAEGDLWVAYSQPYADEENQNVNLYLDGP
jgi:hypothetical protein